MNTSTSPSPHRPWALWLLAVLMLIGAAIGVYGTWHHEVELYGGEQVELIGCVESEAVSCSIVNTSAWSEVLGVPTFTWGSATYLTLALLAVLAARGQRRMKPLLALAGVGAIGFSAFLYYISVVELGKVCLWCMRLYGINAMIPVLVGIAGLSREDLPTARDLGTFGGAFLAFAVVSIGVQASYRATLLGDAPELAEQLPDAPPPDAEAQGYPDDPEGEAPTLAFAVTTEDGNTSEVRVHPGDAWKGNPDAKVAVVEFADFECGYCKRTSFELRRLYEAYKDDVVFVFKHFPMDPTCNPGVKNRKHRYACMAHKASVCAQDQDKFWAMHDLMFKNNHQLRSEHILAYADTIGLNEQDFRTCMQANEPGQAVFKAADEGKALDIHGTPRIYINGQLYRSGSSAEQMARAIEIALGKSNAEASTNAAAMRDGRRTFAPVPTDGPEMQRITHGTLDFFIDTFESSLANGKASSGKHEVPATRMSWFAAADACEAADKRICSEEEWIAACQSAAPIDDDDDGEFADDLIEGNAYPYSDFHERGVCWEAKDRDAMRPVYTGEMPGCVTPDGVYDMTGNIEEWVGTSAEEAVLLGGAYDTPNDKARCYRRNNTFGAGYASKRTGFRCCRNAE